MFYIENDSIYLTRGDTGSFTVRATGYTFAAEDRAVFTIKNGAGTIVLEHVYELADAELGNGVFRVDFLNADTDSLATGSYTWDVRYVIHPYYDSNSRIIDGDQVITPRRPLSLELLASVGEV